MDSLENELLERFVQYAKIDTQSDKDSKNTPSTEKQKDLSRLLVSQLEEIGKEKGMNVEIDEYGYVYAHLPSNMGEEGKKIPIIGFLGHVDTAPDAPGTNVQPRIHKGYDGKDIQLEKGVTISSSDLKDNIGDIIITSDGTTLLGGDDKAGVAEIITGVHHIIKQEIQHGDIYLLFTPDEEVGKGVEKFNPEKFPVKAAYTFDGTGIDSIEDETFHAAKATITIKGFNCHPGEEGFQKMKNAITIAASYENNIPLTERPETTNERHGFYCAQSIKGDVNEVVLKYILRDFDKDILDKRKTFLRDLASTYNRTYGPETVTLEIEDQYPNMKDGFKEHPEVIEIAFEAAKKAGTNPKHGYVRGGTDGAALTINYKIPCPNVFCGPKNIHSVKEFVPLKNMVLATNTLINIVELYKDHYLQNKK